MDFILNQSQINTMHASTTVLHIYERNSSWIYTICKHGFSAPYSDFPF